MSLNYKEDALTFQRMAKAMGWYTGALDGKWGPQTERAYQAFALECDRVAKKYGRFDLRSETNILSLVPPAQILARWLLQTARARGYDARVISGTRSYAEQNALYAQGRTWASRRRGERVVTKARAGFSNHNFLLAWDVGLFAKDGSYIDESGPYITLARTIQAIAKQQAIPNLDIGAFWPGFTDPPHYGLKSAYENRNNRDPLAQIRARYEQGLRWW